MHVKPYSIAPIHFVGIGGIGMSGIAEILYNLGYKVQGSDLSENSNTERLRKLGITVFPHHKASQVEDSSVVVVSSAIQNSNNVEVIAARHQGIPIVQRAEMLGEIMRLKPSIAIAGTHGKTTTTSLTASVLDNAHMDPTVINGGIINAYGTNARLGSGKWIVAEADESDGTFMKLPLTLGIVTNMEPEHLDFYETLDHLKDSFKTFISHIPFYGMAILCCDDEGVQALLPELTDRRFVTYGFSKKAHVRIENVRSHNLSHIFDLVITKAAKTKFVCPHEQEETLKDIRLPMMGSHNISNATAALCAGFELGIPLETLKSSFDAFKGVKRRFTKVAEIEDITIIDDYAHHPTEIRAVLESASETLKGEIIAVVQPHRYTRLSGLMEEFAQCLQKAHHIILTPVYAAGEKEIGGVSSEALASRLREISSTPVHMIHDESELAPLLKKSVKKPSQIIFMGAGDITQWAYRLPDSLKQVWSPLGEKAIGG